MLVFSSSISFLNVEGSENIANPILKFGEGAVFVADLSYLGESLSQ